MSEMETFEIDTELTRDAIYAGIWCHLCNAIRGGRDDGYRVHEYIDSFLEGRGDPLADLLTFLDEDISSLQDARRRITAVQDTPLGAKVKPGRRSPLHAKGSVREDRPMAVYGRGDTRDRVDRGPSADGPRFRKRRATARTMTVARESAR